MWQPVLLALSLHNVIHLFFCIKDDDGSLNQTLAKSEQLRELRQENYNLSTLFLKLKAMKVWRQNHDTANYSKTVSDNDKIVSTKFGFMTLKFI